jgi:hypothetical protein
MVPKSHRENENQSVRRICATEVSVTDKVAMVMQGGHIP